MDRYLLKNGFIADGSGNKGFIGNVVFEGDKIIAVTDKPVSEAGCKVIDCTGKVIAPGFIDCHSHQDRYMVYEGEGELNEPFIRQGITTYVAGNCGFGIAGMEKGSKYNEELIPDKFNKDPNARMQFNTYAEYFDYLTKTGMRQNMALLAAHGIAAGSVGGVANPEPVTPDMQKRIAYLLDEGLDNGCKGISFGLGYRPGNFYTDEQCREVSEGAIKRNKIVAVHERVMSLNKPITAGEEPDNVKWHREFIELYKDSGAKLQLSHLLFVGRTAWPSYEPMMEMFDREVKENGTDLWFDMYSYTQGMSSIQVLLTPAILGLLAKCEGNKEMMAKISAGMMDSYTKIGILPEDVQLCNGMCEEYRKYNGLFLNKVMELTGKNVAELYYDIYKKTNGYARIYFYCEQEERTIPMQMCHDRALYMTDAAVFPGCHQIQTAYNTMPKFLRIARDTKNQSLELTVAKMTGRSADRFELEKRGYLKEGYFADIVVFDYENLKDTSTPEKPDSTPVGIEQVIVNGDFAVADGIYNASSRKGYVI